MSNKLPDEVEEQVLDYFTRTHAKDIEPVVNDYVDLGEGNYRVTVTYAWARGQHSRVYRYFPPENGYTVVRQIHGYHDEQECYGAFCADCGW